MHILVTRVDAIGDVVLTLPVCGYLKEMMPGVQISILARNYTKAVVDASDAIDHFIDYEYITALPENERAARLASYKIDAILHLVTQKNISLLAFNAKIPLRIGTVSRPYHWVQCNRFVWLRRKVSDKHEAELHFRLLRPLGIKTIPDRIWEYYKLNHFVELPNEFTDLFNTEKFTVIIHPKTHGNAPEWAIENFSKLIAMLDESRFRIIITGSQKESQELKPWLDTLPRHVIDITGQLSLDELISFIKKADGLIAGSTGPVHIAAACGIHTLGLYPGLRPKHAGRWGPIGAKAQYLETSNETLDDITAQDVYNKVNNWKK